MAFMKVHNNKGESRLINTSDIVSMYEETVGEEKQHFAQLSSGTIVQITKEEHDTIEAMLIGN